MLQGVSAPGALSDPESRVLFVLLDGVPSSDVVRKLNWKSWILRILLLCLHMLHERFLEGLDAGACGIDNGDG